MEQSTAAWRGCEAHLKTNKPRRRDKHLNCRSFPGWTLDMFAPGAYKIGEMITDNRRNTDCTDREILNQTETQYYAAYCTCMCVYTLSLHKEREREKENDWESERVRNETFGLDAEFQKKNVALSPMEKHSKEAEKWQNWSPSLPRATTAGWTATSTGLSPADVKHLWRYEIKVREYLWVSIDIGCCGMSQSFRTCFPVFQTNDRMLIDYLEIRS